MNTKEEWRPVVGYEGLYEVSNLGRVRSLPRTMKTRHGKPENRYHLKGRILKQIRTSRGYLVVMLGKGNQAFVHRLVLSAFVPNPENKPFCDHIDADRTNNIVSNLRWATYSENNSHPHAVALHSRPVLQIDKYTDEVIQYFPSVKEAGKALKTCYISRCCKGKQKTTAGFKWEYADETEKN